MKLRAQKREATGKKTRGLRQQGILPAVLYGWQLKPQSIQVNYQDFAKVFVQAGESTLIDLETADGKLHQVLVHDLQHDPLTDRFNHVDFYQPSLKKVIEAEVPLTFTGRAAATEEKGGILVTNLRAVKVRALPQELPSHLEADLTVLKEIHDHILVRDLSVPKGVEMLTPLEEVVVLITPPRSEAEIKALEEKPEERVEEIEGVVKPTEEEVTPGEAAGPAPAEKTPPKTS